MASVSVTNANNTAVTGNLGVSPGTSVSGFPPGTVSGSVHAGDAAAADAKADAVAVRDAIAAMPSNGTRGPELGGTTVTPGVYDAAGGALSLDGTVTFDAQGDPDAIFVLRASSLTVARVGNVDRVDGAQEDNIYWQLTGTASLGVFATFRGNVLATGNISVSSGAFVYGRLFSLGGTIAIQGTSGIPATRITVPNDPPTTTSLTSSRNPSTVGDAVTFTATVQPQSGSLVPAGDVVFKDGDTIIGRDRHGAGHPARFTTSSLSPGQHPITAVYLGGDTFDNEALIHFAPSTSPTLVQDVSSATLWSDSVVPAVVSQNDPNAITLGLKFRSSQDGLVTGIRFYKGPQNTGTHVGSLWTTGGQRLASVTFSGETASGWQVMAFPSPVAVSSGTTYVASYHTTSGYYSVDRDYFTSAYENTPLTALASGPSGGNGVYAYGSAETFPTDVYRASNYWVDLTFTPAQTLWDSATIPATVSRNDPNPVVLGVKFQSEQDGTVTGIRFYKGPQNTGTHRGSLWTADGNHLASVTFTGETASGWQQAQFATPVLITANTTYVASYHTTSGRYAVNRDYFTTQRVNGPLVALSDAVAGGNGVYTYSIGDVFPTNSHHASNYWVEPVVQYED
ncbi:DUF4082 domain-containing protein [Microbispora sp. NPDC049633]|uniref:DUF4082 domain-containing protein n=1 Tax=Microbispora sp. NPDC049633 TaxID=3154355 RepID=UPI00341FA3A4